MGCSDPNTVWEEYILVFGAKLGHNPRFPIQAMVQNWELIHGPPFRTDMLTTSCLRSSSRPLLTF